MHSDSSDPSRPPQNTGPNRIGPVVLLLLLTVQLLLSSGCTSTDWDSEQTANARARMHSSTPYLRSSIDNMSIDQHRDDSIRINQDSWSKRK